MPKSPLARMFIYGAIATAILLPISLSIDWFPNQGSSDANRIDTLYDVLLIVSVPIFVLVAGLAGYAWIELNKIEERKKGEMVVDVTGQQFAWNYRYKDPSGKPVQ